MAIATTDLRSFYGAENSESTRFRADKVKASANLESKAYYINQGFIIGYADLKATALVIQPFFIEITPTEEGYVATSGISNVYEFEARPDQAIRSYIKSLIDEIIWLRKNHRNLSASLHRELILLQNFIQIV